MGRWGIREGQLLHAADAFFLFNQSWNCMSAISIYKYCLKCTCIDPENDYALKRKIQDAQENMFNLTVLFPGQYSYIKAINSTLIKLNQAVIFQYILS